MIKKLTVSQASKIGNALHESYQVSEKINKNIYEEIGKFKFISQTMIVISEVRQYLNILENDIIIQRQKGKIDRI